MLLLEAGSSGFLSAASPVVLDFPFPLLDELLTLDELAAIVSSSVVVEFPSVFYSSADVTDALSGVEAAVVGVEGEIPGGTCAFMQMRNACSKMSSVKTPSARTRVPVCAS